MATQGVVDLLVVNFNTKDLLKRLLDTLHEDDDGISWKLHISDNDSSDGSYKWLLKNADKYRIEGLHFNQNIGYARAINMMASESDSEFLAALNADVWLYTRDVRAVMNRFATDEDIAVVGPKQRDEDNLIRHGGIFGTNKAPKHRGWAEYDPYDSAYKDVRECVTVSGSAYFMRRSIWDEMSGCKKYAEMVNSAYDQGPEGAFLPTPHYFEETFMSYHVRDHGYKVIYDGNISFGHTWRASTGDDPRLSTLFKMSRDIFRQACDLHGIEHD